MVVVFTPKKFIDALTLNGIKFTNVLKLGLDRSFFVPRYKQGSHHIKELDYNYKKKLRTTTIQRIADVLVDNGLFKDKTVIVTCFNNDNFDPMLPEDLL